MGRNTKNAIRFDRLRKIANHLLRGKLGHKYFNFCEWNNGGSVFDRRGCGTVGCAVGEFPIIFPRDWKFKKWGRGKRAKWDYPILRKGSKKFPSTDAAKYLNISEDAAAHLFIPGDQYPDFFGGESLGGNATRYEVAKNIREFIKTARENKWDSRCENGEENGAV